MTHLKQISDEKHWVEIIVNETKKSLGVHWSPKEDEFRYRVQITEYNEWTKRKILSEIAKLFDPLGWISPVIIKAKLLIQKLWRSQLDWDEQLPEDILNEWTNYYNSLCHLERVRVPRNIQFKNVRYELHGFCDASEKAYGAVIYGRIVNDGKVIISLLTSKSKVAPIKGRTTLPRLELNAAVLLAKLMQVVTSSLQITNNTYFWTDSMIALAWIQGDHSRWKTYVANRVATIQRLTTSNDWGHVKSKENPADIISRAMSADDLLLNRLWWDGPQWLGDPCWEKTANENYNTETEMRLVQLHVSIDPKIDLICERFSVLTKSIRVIAYCLRFGSKCKKQDVSNGPLTCNELNKAQCVLVKETQSAHFKKEILDLSRNNLIARNSKIKSLCPFLDKDGILRLGGRLENSWLGFNQKHPILLPYSSHFTKLVIQDAHRCTMHGGVSATLAFVRQKYWIIGGRRAISSLIHKCVKCIRLRAQSANQLMGNLPPPRVTPSMPFIHTGVDYAGPMKLRTTKGRGHKSYKGYIAVFVCLSTKAVHLEVVSDLTTESFLAAYKRFTARRGNCSHIYSDNGTNFIGASNVLAEKLAATGTTWHFIPAASPHFGGLWEAAVKSMKFHLKRVVGDSTLTYEEVSTVAYQVEACLNSRPLCQIDNFLIGRPLVSPPDACDNDIYVPSSQRWHFVQKMKADFWKSWTSEYLHQLQKRYKWCERPKH